MTYYEHYSECRDLATLKKYVESELKMAIQVHSSTVQERLEAGIKVAKDKFNGSLFC